MDFRNLKGEFSVRLRVLRTNRLRGFTAAIRAIPLMQVTPTQGACNAVRNVRLPGSINLKPGRDNFEAKLVEVYADQRIYFK